MQRFLPSSPLPNIQVVQFWPGGIMETTQLSTMYTQFKMKRAKMIDEFGFQSPEQTPNGLIRADPFAPSVSKPRRKSEEQISDAAIEKRKSDGMQASASKKSKLA
jgi:hypothetical protein